MIRAILAIAVLIGFTTVAQAQMSWSNTQCNAYTSCLDGYGRVIGQVSCNVLGYLSLPSYGNYGGNTSCRWNVQPYVSVTCAGYQQRYSYRTGELFYTWQNFHFRCPGY